MNAMLPVFGRSTASAWRWAMAGATVSLALGGLLIYGLASSPDRLVEKAQAAMSASPADPARAETLALQAVKSSPLNVRALRLLAQAREAKAPGSEQSARLMTLAGRLSHRDVQVEGWLIDRFLKQGDFDGAMLHLDAAVRVTPALQKPFAPLVAQLAQDPRGRAAIAQRLTTNPPWRPAVLTAVTAGSDPTITFDILQQIASRGKPPTDEETGAYLRRLFELGRYEEALLGWMLFQPPNKLAQFAGVYDGEFNHLSGPQPFNWSIPVNAGGSIAFTPSAERSNDPALHISYDGFSDGQFVYQTLVMPEGLASNFTGQVKYDTPDLRETLQWTLVCVEDGRVIFKTSIPGDRSWRQFSQPFTVPATNCKAQRLELRSAPGERRTNVSAWYDKLAISADTP